MNEKFKEQFVDLYEKEADSVFRFCYIRTSDREIALDLTQETFLKYWNGAQGREMTNKRAFLFTIARNLVIDWYRKKKTLSIEGMSEDDELPFDVADESIVNEAIMADGRQAIARLRELRGPYAEVIYLRFVEGMLPQDIAEVLGENVNTVSVRLTRAIESLRKLLNIKEETKK
jgi:RNA polymerase sigma-70 factor (ECF subfamily)